MENPKYVMGTDVISNEHGKSFACAIRRISDGHYITMYRVDVANGSDVDADKLIEHIASFYEDVMIIPNTETPRLKNTWKK